MSEPPSRGFTPHDRPTDDGSRIDALTGGSGLPLLLPHGRAQTHAIRHKVAPAPSERFTRVPAGLRGHGDSSKPRGAPGHANHSIRLIARDLLRVMRHFGHERTARAQGPGCFRCRYWRHAGAQSVVQCCFRPLEEWRRVAIDARDEALPCDHYIAEGAPEIPISRVLPLLVS